jgi:hypothetical protein
LPLIDLRAAVPDAERFVEEPVGVAVALRRPFLIVKR